MKKTFSSSKRKETREVNGNISVLASIIFMICSMHCFAQLELLKDINTEEDPSHNEYSWLTNAGNYMYFVSNNELWKSHGTRSSTIRLKRFRSISHLTMAGTSLYFRADDGTTGSELWTSKGTPGSTVRVKDIVAGPSGSSPAQFTDINGIVFFTAWFPGKGIELWRTNGTAAGTAMVKDISAGSANPKYLTNFNGNLFFSASGPSGNELWKSDGTAANTVLVKDVYTGAGSSNPKSLTVSNNILFFSAIHPISGREIWKSDGTTRGTRLLKDIRVGTASSGPENLIHANGKLMFTASDGTHGDELWASNGMPAGTVLVKDMNPGSRGSNNSNGRTMGDFTNINGLLYFIASKGTQDFIYRSDGTSAGTIIITEAFAIRNAISGFDERPQPEFTFRDGHVYFFNNAGHGSFGYNLYKMRYNGNTMTLVRTFYVPEDLIWAPYMPVRVEMIRMGGALYFPARPTDNIEEIMVGYDLMRSDGTPQGTVSIHDTFIPTSFTRPNNMINHNGRVYFLTGFFLSYTPEIYRTDGTPEGTIRVRPDRYHYDWKSVGDILYVVEETYPFEPCSYWQLTKIQGTPEEAQVLYRDTSCDLITLPMGLTNIKGILYFFNGVGEVWKSNGTAEGTVKVRSFHSVYSVTEVNGQAFILAGNESNGLQLWKTTTSGLVLVKSFSNTSAIRGSEHATITIDGIFYFFGKQGSSLQVFRSNGTAAGTYRMFGPEGFQEGNDTPGLPFGILMEYEGKLYFTNRSALFAANTNSYTKIADISPVVKYVVLNDRLFMFGAESDFEVYGTDGTSEGTHLLIQKPDAPTHFSFGTIGNYLYTNTFWHPEVWRTDGTICGTVAVDLGVESVISLAVLGDDLVFGGYKVATSNEPYIFHNVNSLEGPVCQEAPLFSAGNHENESYKQLLRPYPNPFTESFTLKIKGNDGDKAQVVIYTGSGMPVETIDEVEVNSEDITLGRTWPTGFYIVKVVRQSKVETYHVVKK